MKNVIAYIFLIILTAISISSCETDEYPYFYKGSALDAVLVIDQSGSMNGTPIEDAKNAAKSFVSHMNMENDQASIVIYSNGSTLLIQLTDDRDAINDAIDSIPSDQGGTTNTGAGIYTAIAEITSERHNVEIKGAVILLSDGVPDDPVSAEAAAQAARDQNIVIVTIGLTGIDNALDEEFLRNAAFSPEYYFFSPSSSGLEMIYKKIYGKLNCPYL